MPGVRIFVTGMGVVSPLGRGKDEHIKALTQNRRGIAPITLFTPSEGNIHPAGQVRAPLEGLLPRTHELALQAARDAMTGTNTIPDAIIVGTTTGGMPRTEDLLREGDRDPAHYRYHATSTVAECLAAEFSCAGPVVTVTTACSSGAAAIALAVQFLRMGKGRAALAGGVDALCRLTYYGFNALQLIDPAGARPLDRWRKGMSVSEGAAMFLLVAAEEAPRGALMEIAGWGLSCDAYHPAAPQPEGEGALAAMRAALEDADLRPGEIHYVNLHGTGTIDNDLAEAKALRSLFDPTMPPLSSTKGATGHPLAAAGAVEAALCALAINEGIIPATTGCEEPDPALCLEPVRTPVRGSVEAILSNSFGFGGNNASLVFTASHYQRSGIAAKPCFFEIASSACLTGAGGMEATIASLRGCGSCEGVLPLSEIPTRMPPREARRLKRLSRIALALVFDALEGRETTESLSLYTGTGWGPLTETHDFLAKLYETGEQFTSPTDFVGSVHNAPAGQAAIAIGARGANVTVTGGDYSFEQALLAASLASRDGDHLIAMGADEYHDILTPLFDASAAVAGTPADGGGALLLRASSARTGLSLSLSFFANAANNPAAIEECVNALGGSSRITERFAAVMVGIPAAQRDVCQSQIERFIQVTAFEGPIIDYRRFIGQFASASAAAAALAARFVRVGSIPPLSADGRESPLDGRGILILGLGGFITAIEITP